MDPSPFVPDDFEVPFRLEGPGFTLRPLSVDDNEADLKAWMTSVDHIHATPGFENWSWPDEPMTPERNHADLAEHEADFAARRGFTFTVVSDGEIIGCVYIYPSKEAGVDAAVRSWVRVSDAGRDGALHAAVVQWLMDAWPFEEIAYALRP